MIEVASTCGWRVISSTATGTAPPGGERHREGGLGPRRSKLEDPPPMVGGPGRRGGGGGDGVEGMVGVT